MFANKTKAITSIRDQVHGLITFNRGPVDRLLLAISETREMQRLRRISQLGQTYLVFPGANHSRFAHCIGTMHYARLFLERIRSLIGDKLDLDHELEVMAAALVHDVGHGPLSHIFEEVTKEKHEKRTLEIILSPETELHQCLVSFDATLPERVAGYFGHDGNFKKPPTYLRGLVSSQLDADRFDYLQRDGLNCGASYGTFAPDWLIHNIYIAEQGGHLYLSHKALAAAEEYVLARYHMYRAVYLHKTTRAAEAMLHALLARFRDLVRKYETLEGVRRIIPDCPKVMFDSFSKPMNLAEYLNLDDALLIAFFHNCADADDRVLADMGRGLLNRRLFKVIDASDHFDPGLAESRGFSDKACTILEKAGFDPRFYFFMDAPVDVPYKHYKPAADKHHQILIQDKAGAIRELSELSPAVRALAREYKLKRYFFPREVETDIRALWAKCIKG